jgi:hypothetical protein
MMKRALVMGCLLLWIIGPSWSDALPAVDLFKRCSPSVATLHVTAPKLSPFMRDF